MFWLLSYKPFPGCNTSNYHIRVFWDFRWYHIIYCRKHWGCKWWKNTLIKIIKTRE
jgi:hypothetical protein